ncbi:hypothetical protein GCM10022408_02680 [Hymenobacter fastidiosus]|uniref:Uncharacterized protein n=1 Tax=Hymenobacter fastidiosus TaxID=486264 RepID=A0ABP7RC65_9BACT
MDSGLVGAVQAVVRRPARSEQVPRKRVRVGIGAGKSRELNLAIIRAGTKPAPAGCYFTCIDSSRSAKGMVVFTP